MPPQCADEGKQSWYSVRINGKIVSPHLNVFLSSLIHSYLLPRLKSRRCWHFTVDVNSSDEEFLKGSWTSDLCNLSAEVCVVHLQHKRGEQTMLLNMESML